MVFQVGDLGADHASDHAAVGALLAGYIVTDLVLTLVLVLQSYSIKEALLLLRFYSGSLRPPTDPADPAYCCCQL